MAALRREAVSARVFWALLLALLLALRMAGSAGYMPSFERGALTIIVCPDADPNAPLALGALHHHHGHASHRHNSCPYAAGSALGALGADFTSFLAAALTIGLALLIGRPFTFLERRRAHERPPLRGPPLPA